MGMCACFFYYHELYESALITISATTNTATFQRQPKLEKAMYFLSKNSHGCDNSKYPFSSL